EYTGAGALSTWLRVVSVRTALNLRRRAKPQVPLDDERAVQLRSSVPDPEIDYLKTRYGREFREAFRNALQALPERERTILSLHFIDGLSSGAIAPMFRVHGATIRRWIERARKDIVTHTHTLLRERLKITPEELESLMGLVRSQLDQSISKLLR